MEVKDIPGDTFMIESEIVKKSELSARLKFYLIAKAYLETNGKDINTMSAPQIAKKFHTSQTTILSARRELRERK